MAMARQPRPKNESKRGKSTDPTTLLNPIVPTEEAIRRRAYELFQARGGVPGQELGDWLQAQQELMVQKNHHQLVPAGS